MDLIYMAQGWARDIYKGRAWGRVRTYILMRDKYLCQCGVLWYGDADRNCGGPADMVHHIIPLNEKNINDMRVVYGEENLLSMAAVCHNKINHHEEKNNFYFDENGMLVERGHSPLI